MPTITTTVDETRRALPKNRVIGLVPTMGALHAGHAALLRQARRECDFVVVSIFVNPTQFGPNEDFHRYSRPFEADVEICRQEGVDLIFHPNPAEMYPNGFQTFVEVAHLAKPLCGASRPGHFRGVAIVVLKLFQITRPDLAYFGQKDAQQLRVVQRMVEDLNVPVKIVVCPIVRGADGLAMSSRNKYLTPSQRTQAVVLHRALEEVRQLFTAGERSSIKLREAALRVLAMASEAKVDYVEFVDWKTLTPIAELRGEFLAALAVHFGATRLIDNWVGVA